LGKIFRVKTVASLHTIYRLKARNFVFSKLVALLMRQTHRVLVPSSNARRDLVDAGVPAEEVDVYAYWIDQNVFKPLNKQGARHALGLRPKGLVILFVGRLIESKGVQQLLATAEKLPEHTFVFVGEGPLANAIIDASVRHPNVIFMGRRDNNDLAVFYSSADLLYGSADDDYVGRVVSEALSCGIPVLLPSRLKIFGIERKLVANVVDADVGLYVDPIPRAIEAQLRKLAEDPAVINSMALRCRDFALSNYGESNAAIIERSYTS
jgi:phosphatidylinositol alpha 1,6-mannosyltransferase